MNQNASKSRDRETVLLKVKKGGFFYYYYYSKLLIGLQFSSSLPEIAKTVMKSKPPKMIKFERVL